MRNCQKHGIMPIDIIDITSVALRRAGREKTINVRLKQAKLLCIAALLMLGALLGGCAGTSAAPQRYEQVFFDVFDTVTTVILYDTSEESANARFTKLHTLLQEYHQQYDIYHAYDGMNNLYMSTGTRALRRLQWTAKYSTSSSTQKRWTRSQAAE